MPKPIKKEGLKFTWYCLIPSKSPIRWVFAPLGFGSGDFIPNKKILGMIERQNGGNWLCYMKIYDIMEFIGYEPKRSYAKAKVVKEVVAALCERIRSRVVLVEEARRQEKPKVPNSGARINELWTRRIRRRVQGNSKPKCGEED